ncbi:hypothetical protein F4802DRAFT_8377 [Xylaria palmicola]|nr:hypothetical protein F4802DRAFT_8377 [Xylaria palmicola]
MVKRGTAPTTYSLHATTSRWPHCLRSTPGTALSFSVTPFPSFSCLLEVQSPCLADATHGHPPLRCQEASLHYGEHCSKKPNSQLSSLGGITTPQGYSTLVSLVVCSHLAIFTRCTVPYRSSFIVLVFPSSTDTMHSLIPLIPTSAMTFFLASLAILLYVESRTPIVRIPCLFPSFSLPPPPH